MYNLEFVNSKCVTYIWVPFKHLQTGYEFTHRAQEAFFMLPHSSTTPLFQAVFELKTIISYVFRFSYLNFKGVLHPKSEINMVCALSSIYQYAS